MIEFAVKIPDVGNYAISKEGMRITGETLTLLSDSPTTTTSYLLPGLKLGRQIEPMPKDRGG